MKFLTLFVSMVSGLAIALGSAFLALGVWGLFSSSGDFILNMEPNWGVNDYAVWGLVLPIVGYLGLLRARSEYETGGGNG